MNADGSGQRLLTRNPTDFHTTELAWSPRGNEIAFVSRRGGNLEIYVVNADGSGQRRLTRNTVRTATPSGRPTGRKIAYESNWQLWVMNADGSAQRRLTRNGGRNFNPAWSPDGRRIAFERRLGRYQEVDWCSGCGGALFFEVHVMNADGSGERRLTPAGARNRRSLLVARWAEDRLRQHPRRQPGDLRHERRRQRAAEPDQNPGPAGNLGRLVAHAEVTARAQAVLSRCCPRR